MRRYWLKRPKNAENVKTKRVIVWGIMVWERTCRRSGVAPVHTNLPEQAIEPVEFTVVTANVGPMIEYTRRDSKYPF